MSSHQVDATQVLVREKTELQAKLDDCIGVEVEYIVEAVRLKYHVERLHTALMHISHMDAFTRDGERHYGEVMRDIASEALTQPSPEGRASYQVDATQVLIREKAELQAKLDHCYAVEVEEIAEKARLQSQLMTLRAAAVAAEDAMREMFRYYDGGETRGSYDGKLERKDLRKAWYTLRAALSPEPTT